MKRIKIPSVEFYNAFVFSIYCYLAFPQIIFAMGWCKPFWGLLLSFLLVVSMIRCMYLHGKVADKPAVKLNREELLKIILVISLIMVWVGFSGIGQYVWQNQDHRCRNAVFDILVREQWPVMKSFPSELGTESRGLIYYIGFWLPAALVGKVFGISAGYLAQYAWAVLGICLIYGLLCLKLKKILIWPVFVFIFFSGLDSVGAFLVGRSLDSLMSTNHMEWWSFHYQFSSNTTQLFWVFNQAIPAWVATAFCITYEKPKNMMFMISLIVLPSTFPFVGLLPYAVYYMIKSIKPKDNLSSLKQTMKYARRNWLSFQNIVAGGAVCLISGLYLMGNEAVLGSFGMLDSMSGMKLVFLFLAALVLCAGGFVGLCFLWYRGKLKYVVRVMIFLLAVFIVYASSRLPAREWETPIFAWVNCMVFLFVEIGVYVLVLYKHVKDKNLLYIAVATVIVCAMCTLGCRRDFCMRASIPTLIALCFACIELLANCTDRVARKAMIWILVLGAITPIHELRRTYVKTIEVDYNIDTIEDNELLYGYNFSGETKGFFWKYIAKDGEEK